MQRPPEPRLLVLWAENSEPWPASLKAAVAVRLPAADVARAERYKGWQDRQSRLLGRLLLQAALTRTGSPDALAAVTFTPHGRPVLPGPASFSLAHAEGRVACAWCTDGPVGVDMERYRSVDVADYAAILSPGERARLKAAADPACAMLRLWTVKEAVAKASGLGLTTATLPDASSDQIVFAGTAWSVQIVDDDGYALAIATHRAFARPCVQIAMALAPDGGMHEAPFSGMRCRRSRSGCDWDRFR